MATENTVVLGVRGDYGNPSGTGMSKAVFARVKPGVAMTMTDLATAAGVLHAAFVTAALTGTTLGDISLTTKSPGISAAPEDEINIDRSLVVRWRTKTETTIHTFTLPGVPTASVSIDKAASGERLNEAGKLAIAAAIEDFYALTPASVVVTEGVVYQKR